MLTMTSKERKIVRSLLALAGGNSDIVFSALTESSKRNGGNPRMEEVQKLIKEYLSGRPLDHLFRC